MAPRLATFLVVLVCLTGRQFALADDTIQDPRYGFTAVIPAGFTRVKEKEGGRLLFVFHRPPMGDRENGMIITIEATGGTVGREQIKPDYLKAKNPGLTVQTATWNGFEIGVSRVPETADGVRMVTFNALIPLVPEAIQIKAGGAESNEAEVRSLLDKTIASTRGKSNWLTDDERMEKLGSGLAKLMICGGIFVGCVIVLVVWLVKKKAKPRRRREREYDEEDDA